MRDFHFRPSVPALLDLEHVLFEAKLGLFVGEVDVDVTLLLQPAPRFSSFSDNSP